MTGYEMLKAELMARGFHQSKVNSNEEFIKAIVTILSDENLKNEIDLVTLERKKAEESREEAQRLYLKANNELYNAKNISLKNENKQMLLEEKEKEIDEKIKRYYNMIDEAETAEARDKIRLYQLFLSTLPSYTNANTNAIIYSMGAILSGQTLKFNHKKEGEKENEC